MSSLQFNIQTKPEFAYLTVQIPANQSIFVEPHAMATMDAHLVLKTRIKGGLKRVLTRENFCLNQYYAPNQLGEIGIAPTLIGDIAHHPLNDETIYLASSSYLAASSGIAVDAKWQGLARGFFSGNGFFLLKCSGRGDLWFNAFGALIEINVQDQYVIDTGHIVAFTGGLEYELTPLSGYKSLFFSGEGLVCQFSGQGKVWIQSKKTAPFIRWADHFRPVVKKKQSQQD